MLLYERAFIDSPFNAPPCDIGFDDTSSVIITPPPGMDFGLGKERTTIGLENGKEQMLDRQSGGRICPQGCLCDVCMGELMHESDATDKRELLADSYAERRNRAEENAEEITNTLKRQARKKQKPHEGIAETLEEFYGRTMKTPKSESLSCADKMFAHLKNVHGVPSHRVLSVFNKTLDILDDDEEWTLTTRSPELKDLLRLKLLNNPFNFQAVLNLVENAGATQTEEYDDGVERNIWDAFMDDVFNVDTWIVKNSKLFEPCDLVGYLKEIGNAILQRSDIAPTKRKYKKSKPASINEAGVVKAAHAPRVLQSVINLLAHQRITNSDMAVFDYIIDLTNFIVDDAKDFITRARIGKRKYAEFYNREFGRAAHRGHHAVEIARLEAAVESAKTHEDRKAALEILRTYKTSEVGADASERATHFAKVTGYSIGWWREEKDILDGYIPADFVPEDVQIHISHDNSSPIEDEAWYTVERKGNKLRNTRGLKMPSLVNSKREIVEEEDVDDMLGEIYNALETLKVPLAWEADTELPNEPAVQCGSWIEVEEANDTAWERGWIPPIERYLEFDDQAQTPAVCMHGSASEAFNPIGPSSRVHNEIGYIMRTQGLGYMDALRVHFALDIEELKQRGEFVDDVPLDWYLHSLLWAAEMWEDAEKEPWILPAHTGFYDAVCDRVHWISDNFQGPHRSIQEIMDEHDELRRMHSADAKDLDVDLCKLETQGKPEKVAESQWKRRCRDYKHAKQLAWIDKLEDALKEDHQRSESLITTAISSAFSAAWEFITAKFAFLKDLAEDKIMLYQTRIASLLNLVYSIGGKDIGAITLALTNLVAGWFPITKIPSWVGAMAEWFHSLFEGKKMKLEHAKNFTFYYNNNTWKFYTSDKITREQLEHGFKTFRQSLIGNQAITVNIHSMGETKEAHAMIDLLMDMCPGKEDFPIDSLEAFAAFVETHIDFMERYGSETQGDGELIDSFVDMGAPARMLGSLFDLNMGMIDSSVMWITKHARTFAALNTADSFFKKVMTYFQGITSSLCLIGFGVDPFADDGGQEAVRYDAALKFFASTTPVDTHASAFDYINKYVTIQQWVGVATLAPHMKTAILSGMRDCKKRVSMATAQLGKLKRAKPLTMMFTGYSGGGKTRTVEILNHILLKSIFDMTPDKFNTFTYMGDEYMEGLNNHISFIWEEAFTFKDEQLLVKQSQLFLGMINTCVYNFNMAFDQKGEITANQALVFVLSNMDDPNPNVFPLQDPAAIGNRVDIWVRSTYNPSMGVVPFKEQQFLVAGKHCDAVYRRDKPATMKRVTQNEFPNARGWEKMSSTKIESWYVVVGTDLARVALSVYHMGHLASTAGKPADEELDKMGDELRAEYADKVIPILADTRKQVHVDFSDPNHVTAADTLHLLGSLVRTGHKLGDARDALETLAAEAEQDNALMETQGNTTGKHDRFDEVMKGYMNAEDKSLLQRIGGNLQKHWLLYLSVACLTTGLVLRIISFFRSRQLTAESGTEKNYFTATKGRKPVPRVVAKQRTEGFDIQVVDNPRFHKPLPTMATRLGKTETQGFSQNTEASGLDEVIQHDIKSYAMMLCYFKLGDDDGYVRCQVYGVWVAGNVFMTYGHIQEAGELCYVQIYDAYAWGDEAVPATIKYDDEQDLAFFYFSGINTRQAISPKRWSPHDPSILKSSVAFYVNYNFPPSEIKPASVVTLHPITIFNVASVSYEGSDGVWYKTHKALEYYLPSTKGWCGRLLYAFDRSNGCFRIVGMHVCGSNATKAGATVVTSQIVEDNITYMKKHLEETIGAKPVMQFTQSSVTEVFKDTKYQVEETYFESAYGRPVVGTVHNPPFMARDNNYFLTPFGQEQTFGPIKYEPVNLKVKDGVDPFDEAAKKVTVDHSKLPHTVPFAAEIKAAFLSHYGTRDKTKRSVLTEDEAINGCPDIGLDGLAWNKGVGTPLNGNGKTKKRDHFVKEGVREDGADRYAPAEDLRRLLDAKKAAYLRGEISWSIFTGTLKAELRKLMKKPRLFMASSTEYVIFQRMYLGILVAAMMEKPIEKPCSVGINPHSDWGKLFERLTQFGDSGVAIDFTDYDATIPPAVAELAREIIHAWFDDDDEANVRIRELILREIMEAHVLLKKKIIVLCGGNPSGQADTSIWNSICSFIILSSAYLTVCQRHNIEADLTELMMALFGDDSIVVAPRGLDIPWEEMPAVIKSLFGMKATPETKEGDLTAKRVEDMQYLSRGFRWDGHRCDAPLKVDRLNAAFYWMKSLARQDVESSIKNLSLELTHYGKNVYESYRFKVITHPWYKSFGFGTETFPPFSVAIMARRGITATHRPLGFDNMRTEMQKLEVSKVTRSANNLVDMNSEPSQASAAHPFGVVVPTGLQTDSMASDSNVIKIDEFDIDSSTATDTILATYTWPYTLWNTASILRGKEGKKMLKYESIRLSIKMNVSVRSVLCLAGVSYYGPAATSAGIVGATEAAGLIATKNPSWFRVTGREGDIVSVDIPYIYDKNYMLVTEMTTRDTKFLSTTLSLFHALSSSDSDLTETVHVQVFAQFIGLQVGMPTIGALVTQSGEREKVPPSKWKPVPVMRTEMHRPRRVQNIYFGNDDDSFVRDAPEVKAVAPAPQPTNPAPQQTKSGFIDTVEEVANDVGEVFNSGVNVVTKVGSLVASFLGLSKPIQITQPATYITNTLDDWGPNCVDNSRTLTFNRTAHLDTSFPIAGDVGDIMSIKHLAMRSACVERGTLLPLAHRVIPICPGWHQSSFQQDSTHQYLLGAPVQDACDFGKRWSGTLVYNIYFHGLELSTAEVVLKFVPLADCADVLANWDGAYWDDLQTMYIKVKGFTKVSFKIGWIGDTPYRPTQYVWKDSTTYHYGGYTTATKTTGVFQGLGTMAMEFSAPPNGVDVVTFPGLHYDVWVSAGDDFEIKCPICPNLEIVPDDSLETQMDVEFFHPSMKGRKEGGRVLDGDVILTMREYTQTYSRLGVLGIDATSGQFDVTTSAGCSDSLLPGPHQPHMFTTLAGGTGINPVYDAVVEPVVYVMKHFRVWWGGMNFRLVFKEKNPGDYMIAKAYLVYDHQYIPARRQQNPFVEFDSRTQKVMSIRVPYGRDVFFHDMSNVTITDTAPPAGWLKIVFDVHCATTGQFPDCEIWGAGSDDFSVGMERPKLYTFGRNNTAGFQPLGPTEPMYTQMDNVERVPAKHMKPVPVMKSVSAFRRALKSAREKQADDATTIAQFPSPETPDTGYHKWLMIAEQAIAATTGITLATWPVWAMFAPLAFSVGLPAAALGTVVYQAWMTRRKATEVELYLNALVRTLKVADEDQKTYGMSPITVLSAKMDRMFCYYPSGGAIYFSQLPQKFTLPAGVYVDTGAHLLSVCAGYTLVYLRLAKLEEHVKKIPQDDETIGWKQKGDGLYHFTRSPELSKEPGWKIAQFSEVKHFGAWTEVQKLTPAAAEADKTARVLQENNTSHATTQNAQAVDDWIPRYATGLIAEARRKEFMERRAIHKEDWQEQQQIIDAKRDERERKRLEDQRAARATKPVVPRGSPYINGKTNKDWIDYYGWHAEHGSGKVMADGVLFFEQLERELAEDAQALSEWAELRKAMDDYKEPTGDRSLAAITAEATLTNFVNGTMPQSPVRGDDDDIQVVAGASC